MVFFLGLLIAGTIFFGGVPIADAEGRPNLFLFPIPKAWALGLS